MFGRMLCVGAAAFALVVVGCGGSGDDDDGNSGQSLDREESTPRPTRTPTAVDPADLVKLPDDACKLVTPEEVAEFSPQLGAPNALLGGDPKVYKACQWQYNATRDFGTLSVEVRRYYTSESPEEAKARIAEPLETGGEELQGLGDYAVYTSNVDVNIEINGIAKDKVVTVSWTHPESRNKKQELIDLFGEVVGRIP